VLHARSMPAPSSRSVVPLRRPTQSSDRGVGPRRRTQASDPGVGPGRRTRSPDPGVGPGRRTLWGLDRPGGLGQDPTAIDRQDDHAVRGHGQGQLARGTDLLRSRGRSPGRHIDLTEVELREVSQWMAQVEWDRARLRSALARTAVAAMSAGPRPAGEHDVLHGLVDRSSAVRSEVLSAAREHAAVYPR
jgi:hypothetical protein